MLNFKKLMVMACGTILALSATIASAAAYDVDITSGDKAMAAKYNYIKVSVSGLADSAKATENFTSDGMVQIKVDKGLFTAATKQSLGEEGLYRTDDDEPTWNVDVNTTASPDYDIINVGWYGDGVCYTSTGVIVDVRLTYADQENHAVATMEILPESVITICDADGNTVALDTAFAANTNVYTLAADSNTVTKTAAGEGGGEEDDDEVEFEEFVGVKEDGVTPDGSVAIATKTTFTAEDGVNEILWTVTPANSENKARTHLSTIDVDGGAEYTLGMVINGLAAEWISAITAVLQ